MNWGLAMIIHSQQLADLDVTIVDTITSHFLSDITNVDSGEQSE